MNEQQLVTLVSTFVGGFLMTWLRGVSWFGEGVTYAVSIAAGILCTALLGAHTGQEWAFGIMQHTLTIFGGVHIGGGIAKARATGTNLPAAVIPEFNELKK